MLNKRQKLIEAEFGEPFADVIRVFREQGATWSTIAGSLEVPEETLRKWVRKLGIGDKRHNVEIVAHAPSLDQRAQAQGYKGATDMIRQYFGQGLLLADVQKALACSTKIYKYLPEEMHGQSFRNPTAKMLAWRRRKPNGNWSSGKAKAS